MNSFIDIFKFQSDLTSIWLIIRDCLLILAATSSDLTARQYRYQTLVIMCQAQHDTIQ